MRGKKIIQERGKGNPEGELMHAVLKRLFPICRSLTGNGNRETLRILSEYIPLSQQEIPTGTNVFDWVIPKEWNIRGGYIEKDGKRIVDFADSNLHVVGYSVPVNNEVSLEELQKHLHSFEENPHSVPYITSYFKETWGFCMSHSKRKTLKKGMYRVFIDSELKDGSLTYGEYVLPGESEKEVFFSTYICHPSMANNELSGPVLSAFIAKTLGAMPHRYTYRFIFIPETIGSIAYISKNVKHMKEKIIAGFNVTCVGDDRGFSYLPTRYGDTLTDRVITCVMGYLHPGYKEWPYRYRGSDERQYCSPLVDLPVASLMRSKYGAYPEYHTSDDDLSLVTPGGLQGSFDAYMKCIELIERNKFYRVTMPCEPMLGPRGLYETDAKTFSTARTQIITDFLAYADGTNDLIDMCTIINVAPWELYPIADRLLQENLIKEVDIAVGEGLMVR